MERHEKVRAQSDSDRKGPHFAAGLARPTNSSPAILAAHRNGARDFCPADILKWMAEGWPLLREHVPGGVRWSIGGVTIPARFAQRVIRFENVVPWDPGLLPDPDLAQTFRLT
jgi:hypothetical protein